ncbi:MAG: metal ABC transporter substrate-binding protein, partial [Bacteroidales bacterium]|nr:metal ABC transporter substrate-binding protein [Bacteroidales bacterium]
MKHYNVWRKLGMGLLALACASGASLAAGAAGGSLSTDTGGRDKPQVAVSIRPLAMIVRELVGDGVEIHQLIDAGQDPHHGALQPSRRLLLDEADLVIWVGPGLESSLARPLANFAEERRVTWLPEH